MTVRPQIALYAIATLGAAVAACSSAPDAGSGGDSSSPSADTGTVETVLVEGTLKESVSQSKSLYDELVSEQRTTAQGEGDVLHDVYLNKDPLPAGTNPSILTIDRWTNPSGLGQFMASSAVRTFDDRLYSAPPSVGSFQPVKGFTTWGTTSHLAPGASNYVITIRGHFQGDLSQARVTHNGIVAHVPAPGAQGLGNSAHMVFENTQTAGDMLIVEVWTNETNQVAAYKALGPEIAMLWAGMPTISRWSTTDWTRW